MIFTHVEFVDENLNQKEDVINMNRVMLRKHANVMIVACLSNSNICLIYMYEYIWVNNCQSAPIVTKHLHRKQQWRHMPKLMQQRTNSSVINVRIKITQSIT